MTRLMAKNRVSLTICGTDYIITSDDDTDYIISIGKEVDQEMGHILKNNTRISVTMAAVLAALQYCDKARKTEQSADHLRTQIKDYLEESANARMEADEARRELERMKREVQTLRTRLLEYDATPSHSEKVNKYAVPEQKEENLESIYKISDSSLDQPLIQKQQQGKEEKVWKNSKERTYGEGCVDATEDILRFFDDNHKASDTWNGR